MHFTALFSVGDRLSYETFLSAVYFGGLSLKEIKYFVLFFFFFSPAPEDILEG